jgi:hypothetical protein
MTAKSATLALGLALLLATCGISAAEPSPYEASVVPIPAGQSVVPGYVNYYMFFNAGDLARLRNDLPHYALFPPVYYSYPVARPYGYSPFAYPPGYVTPELCPPKPVVIRNPFVPGDQKTEAASTKVTAVPQTIRNPYVAATSVDLPVMGELAAAIQPAVIYPAANSR